MEPTDEWYDPQITTFGDRVTGAREKAGLSQAEFAQKLGVKLKTVQGWEADMLEPRANKLQMISGLLNISLPWLINGTGEGPDPGGAPSIEALLGELRALRRQMDGVSGRIQAIGKSLTSLGGSK